MKRLRFFLFWGLCGLLASCGGGGGTDSLPGKNFFVTSQTFSGNLNGTAGADLKCQMAANAAGLGGVYKAWLSVSGEDAGTRLSLSYPLRRSTGLTIFSAFADLVSGIVANAPNVDEFGNVVSPSLVWTNTDSSGYGLLNDCSGWNSNSGSFYGGYGDASSRSGQTWTAAGSAFCHQALRLYCIEQ